MIIFQDNPLEFVYSVTGVNTDTATATVVRCALWAITADVHKSWIREIEASREVMELSTMKALRIYCLAHRRQKNGLLHSRERVLCSDGR